MEMYFHCLIPYTNYKKEQCIYESREKFKASLVIFNVYRILFFIIQSTLEG